MKPLLDKYSNENITFSLTNVSNGIVSKMYQTGNPNGDPNGDNNGGSDPEVVVD